MSALTWTPHLSCLSNAENKNGSHGLYDPGAMYYQSLSNSEQSIVILSESLRLRRRIDTYPMSWISAVVN